MQNWLEKSESLFKQAKPKHFTDFNHCEECHEHDETLRKHSFSTISLEELGNPGWDPLCFCTADGIKYYMPALVRLTLESMKGDYYLSQLLFHLNYDGSKNKLLITLTKEQAAFIIDFLVFLKNEFQETISSNLDTKELEQTIALYQGLVKV